MENEAAKIQDQGSSRDQPERSKKPARSPELRSLEQSLIERLGTKVSIRGSENKGKIEISYYSMEDLERILSLLTGSAL